jgi:chromosome segregation ATPase
MNLKTRKRTVAIGVGLAVCGLAAVTVAAQQASGPDLMGPLSALTNEVRLLRQAVEKSAQTQSQVQAMSIYLSAQQNRLNQAVARGDLLRTQLDAANGEVQDYSQKLSQLERELPGILNERPDVREEVESQLRTWKAELARSTQRQTDLVARLADVDASIQTDLNGWREMIARLEQLTRP